MSMGPADRTPPTTPPLRRRSPGAATGALTLLLVAPLSLVACTDDVAPPVPRPVVEADARERIEDLLRLRAAALEAGDERGFRRTVLRRDRDARATQRTYFDNLDRLPLGRVGLELDAATLVLDDDRYWGEVRVSLELDGYDDAPVVTRDRYQFALSKDGARYVVASMSDEVWEADRQVAHQPWELGPIVVEEEHGVLGIFDEGTAATAQRVVDAVARGRAEVAAVLPASDPVDVIVYALSDLGPLERAPGLPVDDPEQLDAATMRVVVDTETSDPAVASYRILVNDRVLDEDRRVFDRLIRHELTHVMLGDRGRGGPLWLTEGIAEYTSVQPIAPVARRLSTGSLALAEAGLDALPEDEDFRGGEAEAWYGVAWWICEYVARSHDEAYLWRLLDELEGGPDPAVVLSDLLDLTPGQLVRRAMRMMSGHYGVAPEPTSPPAPTSSSTATATEDPMASPTPH